MLPDGRAGAILTIVSGALAIVVALFVILATVASYKTTSVQRRWAATLGSKQEILERYPAAEANAAALELERLTVPLGIDTAPRYEDARPHTDKERDPNFGEVNRQTASWCVAQLERTRRAIDPPPEALTAYLDTHADELEAVRRHLGRGVVPLWEMHMEQMHQAPIPNLLGNINLEKLLVADALVQTYRGEHETANRDLEAGWTLARSLRDHPILISQLIAMADVRMLAGALRQMERPPTVWRARLTEHDFRESFTTALKYEGWLWTQIDGSAVMTELPEVLEALARSLTAPYLRYCLADVSDDFRHRLENLDGVSGLCDYDLSSSDADLEIEIPRWNLVGDLIVPHLGGAVNRLARLELELELTGRLLEAPDRRRGTERSRACPRDAWSWVRDEDGSLKLTFGREPSWPDLKGHEMPTEFRLAPPAS